MIRKRPELRVQNTINSPFGRIVMPSQKRRCKRERVGLAGLLVQLPGCLSVDWFREQEPLHVIAA